MTYRIIEIYNLMDYEFSQVEGDFSSLRESDFRKLLPHNTSFQKLLEQLRTGHSVLLTDVPITPLLIQDRDEWNNKYWRVNPEVESNLDDLAINAYSRRMDFVNYGIGSSSSGSSLNTSMSIEPYTEHESKPLSIEDRIHKQRFERQSEIDQAWDDLQKKTTQEKQKFHLGWTQVDSVQYKNDYFDLLFTSETTEEQKKLTFQYNSHLGAKVLEGELVILMNRAPETGEEKKRVSELQKEASIASQALKSLTDIQIQLRSKFHEVLDGALNSKELKFVASGIPSDGLGWASIASGTIAPAVQRNLELLKDEMQSLDKTYIKYLGKEISKDSFLTSRSSLMSKLDYRLDKLTEKVLKIPTDKKLKVKLGLSSTKSLVHNADEILANGVVPELGKRIANTAKYVKYAEKVGKIGIVLGFASAGYNMVESYMKDDLSKFTEVSFTQLGGAFGGWFGGNFGAYASGAVVVSLGIASAPATLAIVGAGALLGGGLGGAAGQRVGSTIYHWGALFLEKFNAFLDSLPEDRSPTPIPKYINDRTASDFFLSIP